MDDLQANALAAFVVALTDRLDGATHDVSGHRGALNAALTYLRQEPDIGVEALRAPLGLSQPAAVRLVAQLERDGLATKTGGDDDRRRIAIRLTPAGRRTADALLRARRAAVTAALGGLSGRDARTLARIAGRVTHQLADSWEAEQRICRLCDTAACPSDRCPTTTTEEGP